MKKCLAIFEIDIPGLIEYCKKNNLPNNEQTRVQYGLEILNTIEAPDLNPYLIEIKGDK